MIFLAAKTSKPLLKNTFTAVLLFIIITSFGCIGDNNTSNKSKTVFADISFPVTISELRSWQSEIPSKSQKIRTKIVDADIIDWDDHLIPLYNALKDLSDDFNYSMLLIQKYPDEEGRSIGYTVYQQVPQIQDSLSLDQELKTAITEALNILEPKTEVELASSEYLKVFFKSKYTTDELIKISQANNSLSEVSLAYYNNAVSKTNSALFSRDDFSCLSEELLSIIPTDESGNYIFNSNNTSLYFTLAMSCLKDSVREKLNSVFVSNAAEENSVLWPIILERRITYANAYGYEDFSSSRLESCMFKTSSQVSSFLNEIKIITDPIFKRLKDHYKSAQLDNEGNGSKDVYFWNRIKYLNKVKEQISGPVPLNPKLLTYPETFDNMLYLLGKIVGLKFVKSDQDFSKWNNDVDKYLVYDLYTNKPAGTLLVYPYKVENVTDSAAAQLIKSSRILNTSERKAPVIALKAHFNKPEENSTTYLSSSNYITLGHELGHAVHMLLNKDQGVHKKDFNEIPSVFFEKLIAKEEFFKAVLSSHPDTPLEELPYDFKSYWKYYKESPVDICENLRFNLVQSVIINDVTAWKPGDSTDLGSVAKQNLATLFFPYPEESSPFYNVSHVINPATDSVYYLYLLAEVVSADILRAFESSEDNIFDRKTGDLYRKYILENSGKDSEDDISSFLGRKWNYDAFKKSFEEKTSGL